MRIRLTEPWASRLRHWPESGMGYQRVDVRFANGRELTDVPVFNAEEIDLPEDLAPIAIEAMQLHE